MEADTRMIEQVTRIGDLYDLYGALLTSRQCEMIEMYYLDDWSLSEIASQLKVSRQAVHDNIRRAVDQLETYDKALGLLEASRTQREGLAVVAGLWKQSAKYVPQENRDELSQALSRLRESIGLPSGSDRDER